MSNNRLAVFAIVVGLAAAAYLYRRMSAPAVAPVQAKAAAAGAGGQFKINQGTSLVESFSSEVANGALPGQPGYGWKYYNNGTSIDPQGNYYFQVEKVWSPQ